MIKKKEATNVRAGRGLHGKGWREGRKGEDFLCNCILIEN